MSAVSIEGVHVENPTTVWMQLKNTRHNVLKDEQKWNPGGWYDQTGNRHNPFTMCLANAVRWVARGAATHPETFSYDTADNDSLETAERIILVAIPMAMRDGVDYEEIPAFNDDRSRRFTEIVAVLDKAIEMVAPYAKADVVTYADDVMTKEEYDEIRKATWKAEDEMWDEYRLQWGVKYDKKGKWRTKKGKFAKVPPATRREHAPTKSPWVAPPLSEKEHQVGEFKLWLDDHEERGWDTFWDDLLECDAQDPSYEACEAAKQALARS